MKYDIHDKEWMESYLDGCSKESEILLRTAIQAMVIKESLGEKNNDFNRMLTFEINKQLPGMMNVGDKLNICEAPIVDNIIIGDPLIIPSGISLSDVWTAVKEGKIIKVDNMIYNSIKRVADQLSRQVKHPKSKIYIYSIIVTSGRSNLSQSLIPTPTFEIRVKIDKYKN